jgi:hypothetical protein
VGADRGNGVNLKKPLVPRRVMAGRFLFRPEEKVFVYRNDQGSGYCYICALGNRVGPGGAGLLVTATDMFDLFREVYRSRLLVEFRRPVEDEAYQSGDLSAPAVS